MWHAACVRRREILTGFVRRTGEKCLMKNLDVGGVIISK